MEVETKTVGDVTIIFLMKRFDAYTANAVEAKINQLLKEGVGKLLCDFSQTEYLASAGLRVLLSAVRNLQKKGGKLVLCSVKPYVLEVFEISGMNKIFKISSSLEAGLEELK